MHQVWNNSWRAGLAAGWARHAVGAAVPVLLIGIGGCRSYTPAPVDLAAHREEFLARTPESPGVAALAQKFAGPAAGDSGGLELGDGLSLPEAELVALVFNTELRLARLRAGVAAAGAANAGLWDDPEFMFDVTRMIDAMENPWKLAASIGLTFPVSGRLEVEKKLAGEEHGAELTRIAQQEWETRMQLRRAWVRWSAAEEEAAAVREFLGRADGVLAIVTKMEEAGELPRAQARLLKVERAGAAAKLVALETRLDVARIGLKRAMGLAPEATLTLVPRLVVEADAGEPAGDLEMLERRSPALATARAEHEVSERMLELEVRKQYPDLKLGPGVGRDEGRDELMLGISLPVPLLNANRRGIAEAEASREVARAAVQTTLEGLLTDLAEARADLRGATARRRVYEQEIGPLADDQYADVRRITELGEVDTFLLLETLARQLEAKVELIEARMEESLAAVRVQELVGPEPRAVPEGGAE